MTYLPKVSVIMSVFNASCFLVEAIESILRQSYSNFEFIIVDDASTDNSLEIIQSYANRDKRIYVLKNLANIGLGASLNRAIQVSKGNFLARMDADDISLDDRFQKQLDFFDVHPEIKILGGDHLLIDKNGKKLGNLIYPKSSSILRWNMLLGNGLIVTNGATMIRKDFLESLGGYKDHRAAQDFELWSRTFEMEPFPIANLPDTILYYRQHNKTNTNQLNSLQEQVAVATRKKTISKLLDREIPEEVVNSYGHTRFDYPNMEDNFQIWIEVFDEFQLRFKPGQEEKEYIQRELLERMSKYLYLNPFTKTKEGRLSIWRARKILPHAIFHALILSKLGKRGGW